MFADGLAFDTDLPIESATRVSAADRGTRVEICG